MQEEFLHYVWKYKAFRSSLIETVHGETIEIASLGTQNLHSGPDFFNAQIRIADQLWAGNVEIHVKSSDWYLHNHEKDKAYDNVVLHVVWHYDAEIFRKDNTEIPTLELQHYVDKALLTNYKRLIQSKSWINCEKEFRKVDSFLLNNWLERLYIERLERKSNAISEILLTSKNDWEAVLFKMLLRSFGLNINGDAFMSLAASIDYSMIRKLQHDVSGIEALLFGQSDLLNEDIQDAYFLELKNHYQFIKQKYKLDNQGVLPIKFFRLRPSNFPTVRLSQFSNLYTLEHQLFSKVISLKSKEDYYELFRKGVSEFWMSHYTFRKSSKKTKKILTKPFIDLIIINTIIPIKFSYAKASGQLMEEDLFHLIKQIRPESNNIVAKFFDLMDLEKTVLTSQSYLELKRHYCDKNLCLQCAIGNNLITKNK